MPLKVWRGDECWKCVFDARMQTNSFPLRFFPQSELMSAALDTPLNGLGVIPLVSTIPGLNNSWTCMDALNTLVNACRGRFCVDACTADLCTAQQVRG